MSLIIFNTSCDSATTGRGKLSVKEERRSLLAVMAWSFACLVGYIAMGGELSPLAFVVVFPFATFFAMFAGSSAADRCKCEEYIGWLDSESNVSREEIWSHIERVIDDRSARSVEHNWGRSSKIPEDAVYAMSFGTIDIRYRNGSKPDEEKMACIGDLAKIWENALSPYGVKLSFARNTRDYESSDEDAIQKVMRFGRELGIDAKVEALMNGVPVDDIIAGGI
jgi:hypothetical protein